MNFSLIEERLSSYGSGGYYLIESFLLKLLEAEAISRKQAFEYRSSNNLTAFDAMAPNGFSNIEGPVAIEIIQSFSTNRAIKEVSRYTEITKSNNVTLLLISISRLTESSKKVAKELFPPTRKIILWGPEEIQQLIDKHQEIAGNLGANLFANRVRIALENNSSIDDWKTQRTRIVDIVRERYRSGRFSMLLGAGVSSSAGLPDWDTLLNSLFVSMLTEDGVGDTNADADQISSIVKRLRQIDGPSALMLARYIRKGITTDSPAEQGKFIDAVTKQLYGLRNKSYSTSSTLIKSIANLCIPSRTGAKVRTVLTYNFDDLLEREIKDKGLSYKSIFEEIDLPSQDELPIYHVHGFLPENREDYPNISKATLVFSEEGYHQIYREAYHWSNLVQLNSFKESSCLMIGLSLTDPNLRRLLEIAAKSTDRPRHFAFMKRIAYSGFSKDGDKSVVRARSSVIKTFLDRHHKLNEEVLRELGVNIIWYESYDEIPTILQSIGKGI